MKNEIKKQIGVLLIAILFFLIVLFITMPGLQKRLLWRFEVARTYLNGVINPVEAIPTAVRTATGQPQAEPTATITSMPQPTRTTVITTTPEILETPTPVPTATPIPVRVILPSPAYELQDINNCGPASLAMYLKFYGWNGTQTDISDVIKPIPQDRNVNIEEMDFYIKNYAGWLNTIYRVGGDIDLLKTLIAAGYPVLIEETFHFEENYWPNDDLWAGHYLLLNGYDDQRQAFLVQDSFHGADQWISYEETDRNWQAFNRVYTLVYLPQQEEEIKAILGTDWDADLNRQNALAIAQAETEADPNNTFAWFNLGSNYVYFEQYQEAGLAYDKAREIGWPQRMLRYQFGPFLAYFHGFRNEDLMILVQYALERTPNSEEALLWQGWGYFRSGDKEAALDSFQKALEARPDYGDALYALNFISSN